MIKKIELRIFLIIFTLLSFLIGTVIMINTYNSYNLAVKGIASYAERIYDDRRLFGREPEGFYAVRVSNNNIEDETTYSDEIKNVVQKVINKNNDSGIIGNYIYKYRTRPEKDKIRRNNYIIRE